jgi:hypothetical protein
MLESDDALQSLSIALVAWLVLRCPVLLPMGEGGGFYQRSVSGTKIERKPSPPLRQEVVHRGGVEMHGKRIKYSIDIFLHIIVICRQHFSGPFGCVDPARR